MSKPALTFRPAAPDDFDAIIQLNIETYGDDEFFTNRPYFEWQYERSPDGPALGFIALSDQEVVGCFMLLLEPVTCFGRPMLSSHSVGTVVHPDYRMHLTRSDRGLRTIFAHLADLAADECRRRDIATTFTFPNTLSYPTFVKLLGYKDLGVLPFYAQPVRPGRTLADKLPGPTWVQRLGGALADPGFAVLNTLPRPSVPSDVQVEHLGAADERLDRLWDACQPIPGFIRRRDAAYVQWRYFDHPCFRYNIHLATRDAAPLAYVATMVTDQKDRASGRKYRLGHVIDFLSTQDAKARVLPALIAIACRRLRREQPEFIIAAHTGDQATDRALRQAGLWRFPDQRAPRKWPCTVAVHRPDLVPADSGVFERNRWYFNLSDNDIA